ncbi:MAG: LysR substrate-binding domain-containing protein [Jaaginema sp. PMC 1079.18]|nr:LysR substrate-binding domain-containing protein [Jaaginema sp. PMC 1080.18]MEC4853801.1 LysR substrate-binding domain-containing protein [Jaaginema sp. PMC 1079.18]MEC4867545.1 LysR substrate-binding domain-containing protein [Jaaginema sp. PMC 1078.18]
MQVTLHQLKVFNTVARHGNFTRAAEELEITQPTVSGQMKQLANAVGMPLFEQIGKQLYLTDAGQELLDTCENIFERLAHFEMKIADFKGTKQGTLSLCVVTTAKYFIPKLLGKFCQKYPGIDISLTVANHRKLNHRMQNNQDDLYILSQPPANLDLQARSFLENPLVLLAPSDHKLARQKHIPIQALDGETFIMREPGSGTRQAMESLFEQHKITVRVRLELGSNEAIKQAIAGGLGLSVISTHALTGEVSNGELTILDVQGFPICRRWYATYLNGKQLSVVAQAFLDYLLIESQKIPVAKKASDYPMVISA